MRYARLIGQNINMTQEKLVAQILSRTYEEYSEFKEYQKKLNKSLHKKGLEMDVLGLMELHPKKAREILEQMKSVGGLSPEQQMCYRYLRGCRIDASHAEMR